MSLYHRADFLSRPVSFSACYYRLPLIILLDPGLTACYTKKPWGDLMANEHGMSLIEEALRRAERAVTPMPARPLTATSPMTSLQTDRASQVSARSLFLSGVLVSAGLLSWYLVWSGQIVHLRTAALPQTAEVPAETEFIPPTGMEYVPAPMASTYRLSGIVFGPGAPVAVINDRILHPGEMIDNMRVTDISRAGVTLESNDAQVTLRLGH